MSGGEDDDFRDSSVQGLGGFVSIFFELPVEACCTMSRISCVTAASATGEAKDLLVREPRIECSRAEVQGLGVPAELFCSSAIVYYLQKIRDCNNCQYSGVNWCL
jgi:hypothetical protein